MSLLNKLTIKNLKLNKKRTIVTIIGIILSVALITAVASVYNSGINSIIKFEIKEAGDYHIAFYDVDTKDLSIYKNNRNIETVNAVKDLGYAKIDSKNEYKPYANIKGFTKDSLDNLSVNLIEGKLPSNENEILIPTHLKTNGRLTLNVGDEITLNVGTRVNIDNTILNQFNPYDEEEKIIDKTKKTYKVVGIIERPNSSVESYSAPGYTFITYIDENYLKDKIDVYLKYNKKGVKNFYEVTANILGIDPILFKKVNTYQDVTKEDFEKYDEQMKNIDSTFQINSYLVALESDPIKNSGVDGLVVVVSIVILIIVVTSIFCIKNSFDISITEKIKQYGMLRSMGATKKQIRKNVFYEATILGIIGIPLGILSGFFASFILMKVSNYFLNQTIQIITLDFAFSWIAVIIAIILGIVTIYLSALRSAIKASHTSPIESIRNSANIKIKSKKIKTPKLIKKIFGVGGEISYKNIKRNKRKYRTTTISIIVSVSVFIALYGFMSLAFDEIDKDIKVSDYNISLSSSNINTQNYNKFLDTTKLDSIIDYTILRNTSIDIKDNPYSKEYIDFTHYTNEDNELFYLNLIALGKEQYKKYVSLLGLDYDTIKNKGILMDYEEAYYYENNKANEKYMRTFKYNKGDVVSGNIYSSNKDLNLEIGFVTKEKPFGLKNSSGSYLIISDEYFDSIDKTNYVTFYFKSTDPNKLQDKIDEILKGEDYFTNNIDENTRTMKNLFTLVGIFLYGFIIVISLIGITNIFNTITTSISLRKQEFAMLKSVGMTNKEFNHMIRLESLFIGLRSLIFGIPIGVFLSYLIYHFLTEESGDPYKLPIFAILISILVVFILISVIMKYSVSKINKQNIIETIRNDNI